MNTYEDISLEELEVRWHEAIELNLSITNQLRERKPTVRLSNEEWSKYITWRKSAIVKRSHVLLEQREFKAALKRRRHEASTQTKIEAVSDDPYVLLTHLFKLSQKHIDWEIISPKEQQLIDAVQAIVRQRQEDFA